MRITHRLATALLVGGAPGLRLGAGWPSAELRERLRASAIDGTPAGWLVVVDDTVVGDRPDRQAPGGAPHLTIAV